MRTKIFGTILIAMFAISSIAEAGILRLGTPGYGGTGCPAGSASVTVSPDDSAISFLFDSYVAEAGGTTGKRIDRKSCNLSVPVHVPQGYSVAVFSIDYRGFNAIPFGGYSRLNAEYFWAGSLGPRASRTFNGPLNSNYIQTDNVLATSMVWAPCGKSVNLRVNSSMMASTNAHYDQTMSTVDSVDIGSGLIFHLQWRRCN